MPNIFSLIGEAWDFCRRQQAIMHVGFWFLFLPTVVTGFLNYLIETDSTFVDTSEMRILLILAFLILALITIWGTVCVLHIGKRLLQAKSGRTRTSFKSVRQQAKQYFIPYLLTTILMSIFTLLWTLLLIIPGIIYAIRVTFYSVIVVCEGISYRQALNRSKAIVKGQFWPVFGTVVCLYLCTFVPAQIISTASIAIAVDAPFAIVLAAQIVSGIVLSVAIVIYTLALILAYAHFKPASHSKN
jgi:uncharacterized membrane protein